MVIEQPENTAPMSMELQLQIRNLVDKYLSDHKNDTVRDLYDFILDEPPAYPQLFDDIDMNTPEGLQAASVHVDRLLARQRAGESITALSLFQPQPSDAVTQVFESSPTP